MAPCRTSTLVVAVVLAALVTDAIATAPSIYWTSSPVGANETMLIAGAGLNASTVQLCADEECKHVIPSAQQPTGVRQ